MWTDEARDFALKMASDGHSASKIADLVFQEFKVRKSRNAVIGVVHRAGQSTGGGVTTRSRQQVRAQAAKLKRKKRGVTPFNFGGFHGKPAIQITPLPPRHETDIARVSFNELNEDGKRHCKYPIGDIVPRDQPQYCGLEPMPGPGQVYCPSHYARCINTIETRHALAVQDAAAQAPLREVA